MHNIKPKCTTPTTRKAEDHTTLNISLTADTTQNMPTPLTRNPHQKRSSQRSPRPSLPISDSRPKFSAPRRLSITDIPLTSFPATNEGFTTAWTLFTKKLTANYHHSLTTATTFQQKRTLSQCFDASICTLLDVFETRIQDASSQPLGGRIFMDLAYRRFAKGVASTYLLRSGLDVERNAEPRQGDEALSAFSRRYFLVRGLDRYMAGPRGLLHRAMADRDEGLAGVGKEDVRMGKSDVEGGAKDGHELRDGNRVLEWIRNVNSTEDEYWDIVNRRKVAGRRVSGEEGEEAGNKKRLSEELEGMGYASEIDVDGEDILKNGLERNDSVVRRQSAKVRGCFSRPDNEADDDDDDYYTCDEGDDADCTEEENVDDQKTNDWMDSDNEYSWDSAAEETYGTHSDEETLTGSEAPMRSSRKGSSSSSFDEREAKEVEEETRQETTAENGELGSEMAGENRVVAF